MMFKLKKTQIDHSKWIGTVFRYSDTNYTITSVDLEKHNFMLVGSMHLYIPTFYKDLKSGKIIIVKDVSV